MEVLKLIGVSYSYKEDHKILDDINLSFEDSTLYAVLGPSGSGKTTLLSILGGLDVATVGEISYQGNKIEKRNVDDYRSKNVSIIFQNYNLIDYLSAKENIELIMNQPAKPILKSLGLGEEEIKRNILKLSGGQQQRVAIGRALASEATILLADEPTGNLDEKTALEIASILRKTAHQHKKCVIVVTHSKEVAAYADIIIKLRNGKAYRKGR